MLRYSYGIRILKASLQATIYIYYRTSFQKYYNTPPVDVGDVTEFNMDDLDLTEGVIYHFAVTAYGTSPGDESEFSTEVKVRYVADDGVPADADNYPNRYHLQRNMYFILLDDYTNGDYLNNIFL